MNINQIIHKPTHREGNILDFLLTNNTDSIFNYSCSPSVYSDHFIIDVITHLNFENTHDQTEKRNLVSKFDLYNFHSEKINWDLVNKELTETDWLQHLDVNQVNCDQQYSNFLDKCLLVIDKNLPSRNLTKKNLQSQGTGVY